MKRRMIVAAVSALGLVASAGAGTVQRSIWSEGYLARVIGSDEFGWFGAEIPAFSGGRVAWLDSVVDSTMIQASGGAEEHEWMWDPGDYGTYAYQIGWVSVGVDFTLTAGRRVRVSADSHGDAYAVLEGAGLLISDDWAGWLEPGAYSVRALVNTAGSFSFFMDVPAPAGLLALVGGVLLCSRCRGLEHVDHRGR